MPARLTRQDWRLTLWKFITHPATEAAAVVAVVVLALWTLVATEAKFIHSPQVPAIFGPR
jgi:hypothetical protein